MNRRNTASEPTIIRNQNELQALCAECRVQGRFAFDTEFVMEDRFEPEVCLVQIATDSTVAIIDPFLELDLTPIWALMCDEGIETIVHAGQEDLGLCVQHSGNLPRRVFDVQIAAGLVGLDYPLSLQKLVQSLLHVRLHKSKTLTDWRKRPLTGAQIKYAAEDVQYLPSAHRMLCDRLSNKVRGEWAAEEFQRFEQITLYRRVEEEKLRRMKGAGSLGGSQLAILHEMMAWRDQLAQIVNRPVRTVVKDHLMVEIARSGLESYSEIRDLRGLNISDKHVRELCAVVRKAKKMPQDEWPTPEPKETESPTETVLVEFAGSLIRSYCLENELAYSLVASKRTIRQLVRFRMGLNGSRGDSSDQPELLKGWRGRTVGRLVDDLLSGQSVVRVNRSSAGHRIIVSRADR
jgi:ribonuclease D